MKLTVDQAARELSADLSVILDHNISNVRAKTTLLTVFEYVAGSLAEGNELNIPGFGKFKVTDKPERQARNPKTGEMMTVPPKRVFKFTPAKQLKDRIGGV
jgi:DNA-binding protein HU-beta